MMNKGILTALKKVPIFTCVMGVVGCSPVGQATYFKYEAGLPYQRNDYAIVLKEDDFYQPNPFRDPDTSEGSLIFGSDAVGYFDGCPQRKDYTCLFAGYVVFVLPKRMNDEVKEWRYNNYKFIVKERNVSVKMFGRQLDGLYRITIPPAHTLRGQKYGDTFEFLYSPEAGVVAFGYDPTEDAERKGHVHWLTGAIGYGAAR